MPFCLKCGYSYEFGIDKCPKCGTELPNIKSKEKITNKESDLEPKKKIENLTAIPVATIGKRISAGIVDLIIGVVLIFFVIRIVFFRYMLRKAVIRGVLSVVIIYVISALYFILRDSLKGKSIGKLILGLTVVNLERGRPADLADSILRNSVLGIIIVPAIGWIIFFILIVIITIQISLGKEQRIGDRFAHTKVIEDRYLHNILIP